MLRSVDGLLRDKTRPPGVAPLAPAVVDKVVALTLEPPVHEATHWTVRAMAKAVGIAASSVVRIWHDHGLAPHRWRRFKLSNDKAFAEKLHDVVGLYVEGQTIASGYTRQKTTPNFMSMVDNRRSLAGM